MKIVFRLFLAIALSGAAGPVVLAQEASLRIVSLEERLETLRRSLDKGGYLECGTSDVPKRVHYESCSKLHSLSDQGCFAYSTADMGNRLNYERLCEEIPLLEKAHSPKVEYFNVNSQGWWKSIPVSIFPHASVFSENMEEFDRSAKWEKLEDKSLGDFPVAETYLHPGEIPLILDRWNSRSGDGCGEYRDLFIMRRGVLADFDADGVAELRVHGFRHYVGDCLGGSMNALLPGFAVTLKKTSPDSAIQALE